MENCISLHRDYKGQSKFGGSIYIDPLGFEYKKSIVVCNECIFNLHFDKCILFKQEGWSDKDIYKKCKEVSLTNYCEYFIIQDFSEGNDESDLVRERILHIAKEIGY
ncbi:hypothetical protein MHK_005787 [Candidatus Magnetomorum sp. HK-1]|nr:hypothetical protein MHK_005787 [Candidatus Magnetomorum sp. HK-1]